MTTIEFCPICHLSQCAHLSAQQSWGNPLRPPSLPRESIPISLHSIPTPTELSILLAQLADLKRTIADYRAMLDMQAEIIARLSEIEKGLNE